MYERILVPVDGSECAKRAAEYGLGVARAYDAAVDLLYVVDTGEFFGPFAGDRERERYRERGREALEEVAAVADDAGIAVETHLREGSPARSVLDFVDENGVDFVAMGKHGYKGLSKYLLGSTTTSVLRHTDVPVLAVPDGDTTGSVREGFGDVLVPTDGSECAGRAVDHARSVATRFDAPLHVLTAVDVQAAAGPFGAGGVDREWVDRLLADGERKVEAAVDRVHAQAPDADVRTAVVRGSPHDVITGYVADEDVGLVVMGSRGRSAIERQLLGSVAERVVGAGVVPVLVVG